MSVVGMKFGAFDLQANGVTVTDTDVYKAPPNAIQAEELAESDGALIVKQRYTSKTFTINGHLRADTRVALDTLRDTFMTAMAIKNQAFDIEYGGGLRRYLASAQNIIVGYAGATTYSFSLEMLSPDGMGWDLTSTSLLTAVNVTTSSSDQAITVGGSYIAEPTISITIGSISGGTAKTITISNGVSLRGISVTRNWVTSDVLEIDSLKKTVYVNNVATEFKGQLPTWQTGAGVLSYLDDFTTRSITLNASYTKRWL